MSLYFFIVSTVAPGVKVSITFGGFVSVPESLVDVVRVLHPETPALKTVTTMQSAAIAMLFKMIVFIIVEKF